MNKKSIVEFYKQNIVNKKITKIQLFGSSMLPTIKSGEFVSIIPAKAFIIGDILVVNNKERDNFIVHRLINIDSKEKKVLLLGDNQKKSEAEWFSFKEIIGKIVLESKKDLLINNKSKIVITLPFLNPSTFNTNSYEIFQSIKAEHYNTYYYDYNIDFQYLIYDKEKINEIKASNKFDDKVLNNLFSYLKIRRQTFKLKHNLYELSFDNLSECDHYDDNNIKNLLNNYKKSVYYNFFTNKIDELMVKHTNEVDNSIDIFLTVQNYNQLINAVIFAKILFEQYKIKPILVNDSTLFNDKYNSDYFNQFFDSIVSSSNIKSNINISLCNYSEINFNDYISLTNVAQIRISNECYYKKCKFCDRHSKDNFYFPVENIFNKIVNLNNRGVNCLYFTDDCIMVPYMMELIDKLNEENIKIKWKGTFRFEKYLNNDNIIKKIADSGCKMLFFGLESFNQEYLDLINKGTKIFNCLEILKLCKKYGIKTSVSLMFDFPGETISNLLLTEKEINKYIDLIDLVEINFFTMTKNCKICNKDDKINYLVKRDKISEDKIKIISRIINVIKKQKKNMSFILKNLIFLN